MNIWGAKNTMPTPRIQSVDRAFSLLSQLSYPGAMSSLPVIAKRSGLSVATAHRLLSTLESIGAVIRTGSNGYRIGMVIHDLARGSCREDLLVAALNPVLVKLADNMSMTVHAGVMSADQMVRYIAKQTYKRAMPVPTRIGSQLEAYCSGIGKILLANLDPLEQHAYLIDAPFVPLTPRTMTDPALLKKELEVVVERGFAVDDCEIYADLRCVAVPVRDATGDVIAAISCSGSSAIISWEAMPKIADTLKVAAAAIHAKLFPASRLHLQ
jgi:IclR family acetate operon transcriptional repressor